MSRSSRSTKRPRPVSQEPVGSMRDAIALESAPSALSYLSGISDQNGNERQSASSILSKPRYPYYLTLKDLTSLLCPPFKVKISTYGVNQYAGNNNTPAGNLRTIYSPAGQQYWFESIGLPAKKEAGTNATILDVDTLIKKAPDVRNVAQSTPAHPIDGPGGTELIDNPGLEGRFDQQFQYLSGFQRHQFVNSGNTTVHCEFWELHPRHPMNLWNTTTSAYYSIGADVLADYITNQPLGNALAPTYTTTSYDAVTDLTVRITNSLDRVNAKYKHTKPIRVTIQPGGTFVYTMKFEPFKCTNTEWNYLLAPGGPGVNPTIIQALPGFTKILVGRFWGELSHSAAAAGLHGSVNAGPLSLDHIQTEYHHCRAMPYQPTKNTIIDYRLDTSADAVYHMDELEQSNEAFEN